MWAGLVLMGACLTLVVPQRLAGARRTAAVMALLLAIAGTAYNGLTRYDYAQAADASPWAAAAELGSLPHAATIVGGFVDTRPLHYEALRAGRTDLRIVFPSAVDWGRYLPQSPDDAVFYSEAIDPPAGWRLEAQGSLWRLRPGS
jgi:hypothetical protein